MKTPINFKSAKMLAICLTVLLVAGCTDRLNAIEQGKADKAKFNRIKNKCKKNGAAIFSSQHGAVIFLSVYKCANGEIYLFDT